jgi:hypothetical protein
MVNTKVGTIASRTDEAEKFNFKRKKETRYGELVGLQARNTNGQDDPGPVSMQGLGKTMVNLVQTRRMNTKNTMNTEKGSYVALTSSFAGTGGIVEAIAAEVVARSGALFGGDFLRLSKCMVSVAV